MIGFSPEFGASVFIRLGKPRRAPQLQEDAQTSRLYRTLYYFTLLLYEKQKYDVLRTVNETSRPYEVKARMNYCQKRLGLKRWYGVRRTSILVHSRFQ